MEEAAPKYKIGDFVRCSYAYLDFYSYFYGTQEPYPYFPFYGIVVQVTEDDTWFMETVYHVYCLDATYRFFLEDEIELVWQFADIFFLTMSLKRDMI